MVIGFVCRGNKVFSISAIVVYYSNIRAIEPSMRFAYTAHFILKGSELTGQKENIMNGLNRKS